MPAFNLLPEPEQEALVSYVIHLAIRGYAEYEALSEMNYSAKDGFEIPGKWKGLERYMLYATGPAEKKGAIRKEIELWEESQNKPIIPPAVKPGKDEVESIKRGKELFLGLAKDKEGKPLGGTTCVSCHKDYGREAMFKFDEWGTMVRANNLTRGVYRGGARPIDQYYRIHSGINGSGMIPFGKTMTPEQIWDLVNFVRALPHEAMRRKAEIELK
jgi:mono/diheme cytochrome c family protein